MPPQNWLTRLVNVSRSSRRRTAPSVAVSAEIQQLEERVLLTSAAGDFNGDGIDDLAVGVPYDKVGSLTRAGAVNVIYGQTRGDTDFNGGRGLSTAGNELLHGYMLGGAEAYAYFGWAVAVGNFNGDQYDDLAVGVPYDDVGTARNAGQVVVFYGSAEGLVDDQFGMVNGQVFYGTTLWVQQPYGQSYSQPGDLFGFTLAAGDFGGDGFDDLAIGVPRKDFRSGSEIVYDAGQVAKVRGGPQGIDLTAGTKWISQRTTFASTERAENYDQFGYSLAAGNINGDVNPDTGLPIDDLVIGVPFESIGSIYGAGMVHTLYGSRWGGSTTLDGPLTQGGVTRVQNEYSQLVPVHALQDSAEPYDRFGWSLAIGDFNGDGYGDLAIGVPFEDYSSSIRDSGAVNVVYGGRNGVNGTGQFYTQNYRSIVDDSEWGDRFGWSLATGDFDGNRADDLVIGVPYEDVGTVVDAGAVNILYGLGYWGLTTARWLHPYTAGFWHQNSPGIHEHAETQDKYGMSLVTGDFDGDNYSDLAVGVPGESIGSYQNVGMVNVIYSDRETLWKRRGLSAGWGDAYSTTNDTWWQGKTNAWGRILGRAEYGDGFGW